MSVTIVDNLPMSSLGEGPWWDEQNQRLYWVDIMGQRLHDYAPTTQIYRPYAVGELIGFAVPESSGQIIAGLRDGLYRLDLNSRRKQLMVIPNPLNASNRFNDGKCDRLGRIWCGTMNINPDNDKPTGSLYRYDSRGLIEMESEIYISNGLGWNANSTIMYYADTVRRVIWQYDYDLQSGTIGNRRVFVEIPSQHGRPDGLTVDSQGRVLCAMWPGWRVNIYAPDGKLDDVIRLPVPQVSSCIFGGSDLKTLFITTASVSLSEQQMIEAPLSGCLFSAELDIAGLPEARFNPNI